MSCRDCFSGSVHEGVPQGFITKVFGVDTYVSEPPDGAAAKGIIVIIPDALGQPFVNNQLLADHYAAKGSYRVYLPDFMKGYACPPWMLDGLRKAENSRNLLVKMLVQCFPSPSHS